MRFWSFHSILKKLYYLTSKINLAIKFSVTLLKIFIYTRKEILKKERRNNAIFIGNSKDKVKIKKNNKSIRAVSNFLIMDDKFFKKICPTHYFLIDPLFFTSDDDKFKKLWIRLNNVNQPLILVVPTLYYPKAKDLTLNPLIIINTLCLTPIDGPKSLIYYLTLKGFGAFKIKNVLGAFLIFCLRQKISNINLYGVNHDWSRYMFLNDNLELCLNDGSHKNSLISSGYLWKKTPTEIWRVSSVYKSLHETFLLMLVYIFFS